jgi:gluconolactonase
MSATPRIVPTTVHATLPKELHLTEHATRFTQDLFHGRKLASFLEGPSFDRDGNLYMVDIAHGRIFRLTPGGEWQVVTQYDGAPNGLKLHKDGRLFVSDRYNGIMIVDPVSGKVEAFLGPDRLPGFKGPNDLFFASNGDLYFTDQGATGLHDPTGRVFRYSAAGKLDCLIANVPSPNGLVMNPEESELFIAVTRENSVWRMPFRGDGSAHRVGMFARLAGGWGPDGMAVDKAGNLLVCHAGFSALWLFSPLGIPTHKIEACDGGPMTTNVAYGGKDGKSIFITNSFSNNVLRAELAVAGETMFGLMD